MSHRRMSSLEVFVVAVEGDSVLFLRSGAAVDGIAIGISYQALCMSVLPFTPFLFESRFVPSQFDSLCGGPTVTLEWTFSSTLFDIGESW